MCRHLVPHFDFPVGQIFHSVGRLVAIHPASTVVALMVPILIVACVMARHRLKRPVVSHLDPPRVEPPRHPPGFAPGRLRIIHQG